MAKILNDYAVEVYGYDDTPKSVFAALALSFALRLCEDDIHRARELLIEEWEILHRNEIIPQKPINNFRTYLDKQP